MVLAAGFGLRMRPLSNEIPKPLLKVGGIPMIERMIGHLVDADIQNIVVNTHYLADQFFSYFDSRENPTIKVIYEEKILDTGGGVTNALRFLDGDAFPVLNSDVTIFNGDQPLILRLLDAWNPQIMDALLLIQPIEKSSGYSGLGDFYIHKDGSLSRRTDNTAAPFLFTGIQILKRSLFQAPPAAPFSLNVLYNRTQDNGKLFGLIHDGEWMHVGTPEAISKADKLIRNLE